MLHLITDDAQLGLPQRVVISIASLPTWIYIAAFLFDSPLFQSRREPWLQPPTSTSRSLTPAVAVSHWIRSELHELTIE